MSSTTKKETPGSAKSADWYDLFSRGARDWLRHNEKIREAVKEHLPDIVANLDFQGGGGNRTVRVPVRFLEHYRFSLRRDVSGNAGVGQGDVEEGDVLQTRPDEAAGEGSGRSGSGSGEGEMKFMLELKIGEIVDWIWEELKLPHLKVKSGKVEDEDYNREGWDKRGARARLDRRRTLKEAVKRRAVQKNPPPFTNEDLRFRQLVKRQRPATEAVVFFALDASSSMGERDRKLAKSFFFWALQGLRRQYNHIETRFVAHTVKAWEFSEEEFFQVQGSGGTVASTAFDLVGELVAQHYSPDRFNLYLFYASDGENFPEDQDAAMEALQQLAASFNFLGYVETLRGMVSRDMSYTNQLFTELAVRNLPAASFSLNEEKDVWDAIRAFFNRQSVDEPA